MSSTIGTSVDGSGATPMHISTTTSSAASAAVTPSLLSPSSNATNPGTPVTPSAVMALQQQQQRQSARRLSRKSTLTQQQKNHKRQRATQDQLITLESEFNKNPTPTAAVREKIAQEINMTERSVQIWFQNRRAKIKMIAKKGMETGEDLDSIPESMRKYLAAHFDPSKGHARNLFGRGVHGPDGTLESASSGKVVISHFSCQSLRVGTWRRVGQNAMDLVIFYSPEKSCMTYYIHNDSAGYKIEYPFAYIKSIVLDAGGDQVSNAEGAAAKSGGLIIELNRPPNFYMDSSNSGGFYQCGDFTEDQQATKSMIHYLGGHPRVLGVQLAKLASLESFQNRLAPSHQPTFTLGLPASAPVSPHMLQRPASQPNHLATPPSGPYQENFLSANFHVARGHKRQRSRSVPVQVDFSAMHMPIPSFHIHHPSTQFQPDPNIFAPIPQGRVPPSALKMEYHVDHLDSVFPSGPLAFRQFPAAPCTVSSTGFANPAFFAATNAPPPPPPDQIMSTQYSAPFSVAFPTPPMMVDAPAMIMSSVSASVSTSSLTQSSQPDPIIADNNSPPLSVKRSSSVDMFSMPTDPQPTYHDDSLMLSEMYSKQNLNMSMPSPGMDDETFALALQGYHDGASPATHSAGHHGLFLPETVDPSALAAGT